MRKRLQIVVMAAVATSMPFMPKRLCAGTEEGPSAPITASNENGRRIYINESVPARRPIQTAEAARHPLMYWSTKANRWKPVPDPRTPSMKAARSAAAEVGRILGRESSASANARIQAANSGAASSPQEIDAAITMAAARHNVDPNLVRAVVKVESNFNPNAVSRKGAMGLMQLMPSTARQLKVQNPFDPQQNVDAGVRHLKQLLESYGGDVKLTLAAYNAGSGAVARSAGVPHFAETQNYVRRITNLYYAESNYAESNSAGSHYGGFNVAHLAAVPARDPVTVQRDARGVLYISNTD